MLHAARPVHSKQSSNALCRPRTRGKRYLLPNINISVVTMQAVRLQTYTCRTREIECGSTPIIFTPNAIRIREKESVLSPTLLVDTEIEKIHMQL